MMTTTATTSVSGSPTFARSAKVVIALKELRLEGVAGAAEPLVSIVN